MVIEFLQAAGVEFSPLEDNFAYLGNATSIWVAVKELNASCYIGGTLLFTISIYIYMYIYQLGKRNLSSVTAAQELEVSFLLAGSTGTRET